MRADKGLKGYDVAHGAGSPLHGRIIAYCDDLPVYSGLHHHRAADTLVVLYGSLRDRVEIEISRPPLPSQMKKRGIRGLFGATETVLVPQKPKIEIDYAEVPLRDVVIGTSDGASNHRLTVDGKIACEEIRVQDSDDWPDYVFEETYPLQPLK